MAQAILETAPIVIGEVVDVISGIINENKETLGKVCEKFPGKNTMIVWTPVDSRDVCKGI